ncbi:MAG TPA: hypothetical protein VFA19_01970 [Gaiellaceae bacterium]|nr:hypothetical protein [Gaiellaceae bacterium]
MRTLGAAFTLAIAVQAAAAATPAAAVAPACRPRGLHAPRGLPAPVLATTSCGTYALEPNGRVAFAGRPRQPVPPEVESFPDLTWFVLRRGRLVVGSRRRVVWRSTGRYEDRYGIGVATVGPRTLAFSYEVPPGGWKRPTLFVAPLGGRERIVARDETPLGWTARGALLTWGGGVLRVRAGDGTHPRILARDVHTFDFAARAHAVFFVAHGRLERFDGRLRMLARLGSLRIGASLAIEPLGRFVALQDGRRLVVLRANGRLVSATPLPQLNLRTDLVSSVVALDRGGDAAFTATRGNTAYGSRGVETVYLLRPGARRAEPVHRERVDFAVCERQAALAWRGRWLLYTTSEGYAAAIDVAGARAIDLSAVTRRLPGADGEDFAARW